MLNIHSHDVADGNVYSGTWNLSRIVSADYKIVYTHFDTGSIPVIFSGADSLVMDDGGGSQTIILDDRSDNDKNELANELETKIIAAFTLPNFTVTYDSTNDEFVFSNGGGGDVLIQWSDASSTAGYLFDKFGDADDDTSLGDVTVTARHINDRPVVLEVFIDEAVTLGASTRDNYPDMIFPLDDLFVDGQTIKLNDGTTELGIEFYRTNIPNTEIPFTNEWHMVWMKQ